MRPIALNGRQAALRAVLVLAVVLMAYGSAQECLIELEPNNTPAEANALGAFRCAVGELAGGDQDAFSWTVDEAASQKFWQLEIESIPGQLTIANLIRVAFADNGIDVTSAETLFEFGTRDGSYNVSEPFLIAPGSYLLGASASGGEGTYVLKLTPAGELRSGRSNGDGRDELEGAFALYGALQGERAWTWTITADDARRRWQLELQGPVGGDLALELTAPDGSVVARGASDGERLVLPSLGLAAGAYRLTLRGGVGGAPYALDAVSQGLLTDGGEIEPNDRWEDANILTFERPLTGGGTNTDYFVFEVSAAQAGRPFDLQVASDDDLSITLYDAARNELQRRSGVSGALRGLVLPAGSYGVVVRASGERYELRLVSAGSPPAAGFELEPNDALIGATPLSDDLTARGELTPQDRDVFSFRTGSEAQLWRVQVLGQGRLEVSIYTGGGAKEQTLGGDRRLRLDNVLLLPGEHFVELRGDEGEYALRLLALGPPPEPPPPDPDAAAPLTPAPAPPAADENATVETATIEPVGPPPPPGQLELEPNDDDSRAELLEAGVTRVGALSTDREIDTYRFFLANDQYVRIEAVPPADGEVFFDLSGVGRAQAQGVGKPVVMERWLLAGDYFLRMRAAAVDGKVSSGYYQLRLAQLDPLALPDDFEPNDEPAQANALPADLNIEGQVGVVAQRDHYALPVFGADTELRIGGELGELVRLDVLAEQRPRLERTDDGYVTTLPAGVAHQLRISGRGSYRLTLTFGAPPDPAALAPPTGPTEALLSFAEARAQVTAYWHQGQRYQTELTLENRSSASRTFRLTAASSHIRVRPMLPAEAARGITLGPGERTAVPLLVQLPHDLRDDQPIRLAVGARDEVGLVTAALTLEPRCAAPPLNPVLDWELPESLLGGLNVAWDAFGIAVESKLERNVQLFDGRTSLVTGGHGQPGDEVTVDLPGDEPIELAGTLLHPQANSSVERQLRTFEVLVSLDGETFEPVLAGELAAARVEQAFVFERPVAARYVRLRFGRNYAGQNDAWLGEWKLVAAAPNPLGELNLADPRLGGYVVWSDPLVPGDYRGRSILSEADDAGTIPARGLEQLTWVVGFHHNRAAMITRLVWLEQHDAAERGRSLDGVTVEVSLTSPVGPWQPLAEWTLARDAGGRAVLELPAPVWARFLRFTSPVSGGGSIVLPEQLQVIERPAGDGYRSALGEWGHYRREAVFEQLNADAAGASGQAEADDNDSRERAQRIASGEAVTGSVQVAEDVDWFRFEIAPGENLLELTLSGDPTIAYLYELYDASGAPLPVETNEVGSDVVLRYFGEPGTYYLRLEEPKRSVIFSWDTSGSVGPYTPITYASLARFARDLDPEREFVQLLAFDEPTPKWLLPYWSADPLRVQQAINDFDRDADSSNAELALLTASRALEQRDGTRAVLFITDAESPGYQLTPDLWRSLSRSRARVFTFEISTAGSAETQDLMQSWANVNDGHYDYARNVGDFDAGFARASCRLRRPKRYRVAVATDFRAPPGPGSLRVLRGEGAALPAVEVILDASGSMGKKLPSGESRIDAAKRVLEGLVTETLPPGTPFALRAFGHVSPNSCEMRLEQPLAPLEPDRAAAALAGIAPKLLSQTPLAEALLAVADDLAAADGAATVVLLTDGEESCGGDPAAAVAALREQLRARGVALQLAIVSLGLDDPAEVASFEALAEAVGASYVDAQDLGTLETSIAAALRPPFEVLGPGGEVIARGIVGDDGVPLPAGVYTVRVLGSPTEVFREVRVPSEQEVTLTLGAP